MAYSKRIWRAGLALILSAGITGALLGVSGQGLSHVGVTPATHSLAGSGDPIWPPPPR